LSCHASSRWSPSWRPFPLSFGTAGADGSTPFTGTLTVKSGTGSFKGATGKLKVTGSQNGDAFKAKLTGTATY
ncbi:MAG: hypothetical protein ACXVFN_12675, partial [Solirubrobacteraceae bacterium]